MLADLVAAVEARGSALIGTDPDVRFTRARVEVIERLAAAPPSSDEWHDIDRTLERWRDRPDDWSGAYEALVAHRPTLEGPRLRLALDRRTRRQRGSWYTPPVVVEAALTATLDPLLAAIEPGGPLPRVCDPACGTGRFLLAAAHRLTAALVARGVDDDRARRRVVLEAIHGADLDAGAVAVCGALLRRFAGVAPPAGHLLAGDALRGPAGGLRTADAIPPEAIQWDDIAPEGYDVVVGNPPYRAGRLADLTAERVQLAALIPTAEYQLDPFALFLDRGARLARRRLGLLVPTTWMSNHRMRRLRRWLLACHRLDAIIEVPADAFDAVVETAVAVFTVGAGPTRGAVPVTGLDGRAVGTALVDPEALDAPLPLARSRRAEAIVRRAAGWTTRLGDVAEVTRGINPYHHTTHRREDIAARIHHADHRVDDTWSPELRGRDLPDAYRLVWRGDHWIHYGPWLKEPRAPRFFTGRRLLVRKILGRTLNAVFVERDLYCDQSVYIARLRDDCPYPAFGLLACVNSDIAATLVRTRHQTHQTHFPQLKVGELRALPLPPVPPTDPRWAALAALARAEQDDGPDPARRRVIERRVGDMYGVPDEEGR